MLKIDTCILTSFRVVDRRSSTHKFLGLAVTQKSGTHIRMRSLEFKSNPLAALHVSVYWCSVCLNSNTHPQSVTTHFQLTKHAV